MNDFGFIITRCVNSEKTNRYWNHSVKILRFFYPTKKIVIIDDNSDTNFLKADFDYSNVEIIQSEFPGRGELLPYYYFIKNKFFENAVIIHDSVFFHKRINFEVLNGTNVLPLWYFDGDNENESNTIKLIENLKNKIQLLCIVNKFCQYYKHINSCQRQYRKDRLLRAYFCCPQLAKFRILRGNCLYNTLLWLVCY